jgi:hypothetical protein
MTVKIDFIPGMPPDFSSTEGSGDMANAKTNQVLKDSMPIVHIEPGTPNFKLGADYFVMGRAFKQYHDMLRNHGFELSSSIHNENLTLAYVADNFPTDTFANEYGENFFQSMTNIASEGAASLAQVMGVKSMSGMAGKLPGLVRQGIGGTAGDMLGGGLEKARDMAASIIAPLAGGKGLQLVDKLMAGGRIDFPMLWKNSTFQPSYTMTIRLYNPNPASEEATEKYIIGPIAAILILGVPISEDTLSYNWPFIHKITSPGIYSLNPGFISNITVVKGGDQQQIAMNQKLALVDVRIDMGSLFNSMLVSRANPGRPTVLSYIENLKQTKAVQPISDVNGRVSEIDYPPETRYLPGSVSNTGIDEGGEVPISQRVSDRIKSVADSIINQIPGGFKIGTE